MTDAFCAAAKILWKKNVPDFLNQNVVTSEFNRLSRGADANRRKSTHNRPRTGCIDTLAGLGLV
jgi:hypothetical protein